MDKDEGKYLLLYYTAYLVATILKLFFLLLWVTGEWPGVIHAHTTQGEVTE